MLVWFLNIKHLVWIQPSTVSLQFTSQAYILCAFGLTSAVRVVLGYTTPFICCALCYTILYEIRLDYSTAPYFALLYYTFLRMILAQYIFIYILYTYIYIYTMHSILYRTILYYTTKNWHIY